MTESWAGPGNEATVTPPSIVAKCLSVRHIIVRVRRALMGLLSEVVLVCMYVCMYVCQSVTGLRLKYTSLRIVYVPSGTWPSWCARAHYTMQDLEERRRRQARERVQRYIRGLFN